MRGSIAESSALVALLLSVVTLSTGFIPVPSKSHFGVSTPIHSITVDKDVDARTGKRTGTSFLPQETFQRAIAGSPIEKIKLEKDGTSAFVDVYEYAAKIRAGEMTWEDVEKADLESVRFFNLLLSTKKQRDVYFEIDYSVSSNIVSHSYYCVAL